MAYRYLFITDLYEEWNRETLLWEAVPERCLKWLLFIVLKWRKISEEICFLWRNRKCTWSEVQKLAITHPKYLTCENMCELSFLKTFWCCRLFLKNYQILGQRWNWEGHVIEIDPATSTSKGCLLLPVPFHLHAQMFKQPGLLSAVLIPFLGSLHLGQCWADTPTPGTKHSRMVLLPAAATLASWHPLCVLARDSTHNEAPGVHWKGFLLLLLHSPSSLGSCTLQSCAYEYVYMYKYFSLAVWRKYTLV